MVLADWSTWRVAAPIAAPTRWLALAPSTLLRHGAAERDRWVLWLPVGVGAGIAGYFSLTAEPPPWLGVAVLAAVFAALAGLPRSRPSACGGALIVALTVGSLSFGFTVAQWRTHQVAAPVLAGKIGPSEVGGRVSWVEQQPNRVRLLIDRPTIVGLDPGRTPVKVRLTMSRRQAGAVAIGDRVTVRAVLRPPPAPAAPGAFDFQRYAYFQRLGGVGYAVGRLRHDAAPPDPPAVMIERARIGLAALRAAIAERVRATVDGAAGAVAAALMTGDRSAIPQNVLAAMRDSGLAHLLAISGLHIGLVAAILFFGVRAALASAPSLALRHAIKKWAAIVALGGAFAYLLISGATVPTQRAFLMTGIVLVAVLVDRAAISMRLVAWAALAVLLLAPESLLGPSFQMSFAAVIALVAGYEALRERFASWRLEAGPGRRVALYLAGVAVSTIIAMAATAPFAIYHFNRVADYGLAANLVAVPLTAFWIMPWAVAALCLMPLGLDAVALAPMGWGIELLIATARTVGGWPGAVRLVPAMPAAGLALVVVGGLWLCLWRRRWRLVGLAAVAAGLASPAVTRPPDILVAGDGKLLAVRATDGALAFSSPRASRWTAEMWLRRAGQFERRPWPRRGASADGALRCDNLGCLYRATEIRVALVLDPRALAEDCRFAELVISVVPVGRGCRHVVSAIDRFDLWREGAHAVWITPQREPRVQSVAAWRGIRPWAPPRRRNGRRNWTDTRSGGRG
jgi:competence protein ComEC